MNHNTILPIIRSFYIKATNDVLIGYHFRNIQNFDEHIPKIASFWELQLTGSISNKQHLPFDLINKHLPLQFTLGHMNRWIQLFTETLNEVSLEEDVKEKWLLKVDFFKVKLMDLASRPLP